MRPDDQPSGSDGEPDPREIPDASSAHDSADESARRVIKKLSTELRVTFVASTLIVAVVGGLTGYLGYRTFETRLASSQSDMFVQAGRQAAINLTTISYTQADADVARILESATGTFQNDFQKHSQSFIDVVKNAQSSSEGNVTSAGLESINGDEAEVIVAISVKTSYAGVSEQQPRGWRMRISLQRVGETPKVSDVQFVP